jgi:hypothetical protein
MRPPSEKHEQEESSVACRQERFGDKEVREDTSYKLRFIRLIILPSSLCQANLEARCDG